ncbi:hypothetical protein CHS0354_034315, partial [Potamilus streckersoni]
MYAVEQVISFSVDVGRPEELNSTLFQVHILDSKVQAKKKRDISRTGEKCNDDHNGILEDKYHQYYKLETTINKRYQRGNVDEVLRYSQVLNGDAMRDNKELPDEKGRQTILE